MSCDEAIEQAGRIVEFRNGLAQGERPQIEVGIATAFGCTLQGAVEEDWVFEMANRLAAMGGHVPDAGLAKNFKPAREVA